MRQAITIYTNAFKPQSTYSIRHETTTIIRTRARVEDSHRFRIYYFLDFGKAECKETIMKQRILCIHGSGLNGDVSLLDPRPADMTHLLCR